MSTKLKIDLSQGLLEVEGSEAFVKSIYADFKTHFAGIEMPEDVKPKRRPRKTPAAKKVATPSKPNPPSSSEPNKPAPAVTTEASTPVVKDGPVTVKPPSAPGPYTYLDDLDVTAAKGRPSLVDFMDSKLPITNEEHNIVFLYYMQYLTKIKGITIDHLFTAYRAAKIRAPLKIENTFDQRGWIKVAKNGNMTLTAAGKKYVEESMPKKLKG